MSKDIQQAMGNLYDSIMSIRISGIRNKYVWNMHDDMIKMYQLIAKHQEYNTLVLWLKLQHLATRIKVNRLIYTTFYK